MKIILIILCLIVIIYLITAMVNSKKNKMITTPFYTWDVKRETATRMQTFVNQYSNLSDTPNTKNKWLDSFATTIYELGVIKLNNRKYAKVLLDRSMHQVFKENAISADINNKINEGFFNNFTKQDYEKFIENYALQIADKIKRN